MTEIFDKNGKLKFPEKQQVTTVAEEAEIINYCCCPNGHNLVSSRVKVGKNDGILLKVSNENQQGFVGLSAMCGCKLRISMDIDLVDGEQYDFFCPECDSKLPVFNTCPGCGGELVTLFLDERSDYNYCIGICNRSGCPHSEIRKGEDLRICSIRERWD